MLNTKCNSNVHPLYNIPLMLPGCLFIPELKARCKQLQMSGDAVVKANVSLAIPVESSFQIFSFFDSLSIQPVLILVCLAFFYVRMTDCRKPSEQATTGTPSKHGTLTQCRLNVGPPSATLAPHLTSSGSASLFFLGSLDVVLI